MKKTPHKPPAKKEFFVLTSECGSFNQAHVPGSQDYEYGDDGPTLLSEAEAIKEAGMYLAGAHGEAPCKSAFIVKVIAIVGNGEPVVKAF